MGYKGYDPVKLILDDAEAQVALYNDAIETFVHRKVRSAADRGYSDEEIAAFLEIPVELVMEYLSVDPELYNPL